MVYRTRTYNEMLNITQTYIKHKAENAHSILSR